MKRLSPLPVVSVWPLVMEKTSARRRGHPGTWIASPDAAFWHEGPMPTLPCTHSHAQWNPIRPSLLSASCPETISKPDRIKSVPSKQLARGGGDRCRAERSRTHSASPAIGPVTCHRRGPAAPTPHETSRGFQVAASSPYFSSSLTLSIRGAVSPARHVLTRPRPHPFSRQQGERTSGRRFRWGTAGARRAGDAECVVKVSMDVAVRTVTEDGGCGARSRHGCQPWPQTCGVDLQEATTFPVAPHRGNPEDAPGCSVAEQRSRRQ